MKKILFGLLLLFSTSLHSQSDVIQDSFILVVDYDTVNVVNDSTFLVFISAKSDQFGNGYIATGIDSGYIFIDGRGGSYYVDSIGSTSATDGWFRIIENEIISGSPSGRGWVFKPLSSGLIPVPPSNANGVAPILVAKVIANNAIKARTYYVDSSTTIVTTINAGGADIDTIPVIDGISQNRLDTMNLIGITSTMSGWVASTAARDTLYPDAFVFSMYGSDSMIIAYSGTIEFQDSVFERGKNYYQPYAYTKYSTTADTILEMLVFKAVDTNKIEIRDRYSYLADGADQTSRSIPDFVITYENFVGTNKDLYYALIPSSTYWDGSTYTNPVDQTTYTQPTVGDRPSLTDGQYFTFGSEDWLSTGAIGETDTLVAFIKYRVTTDVNFGHILGDNALQNESIMSVNNGGYKWAYQFGNPYNANSVIGLDVDRILAVRVIVGSGKIYVYDPSSETYIADQTPNLTDLQGTTLDEININANQNGGRAGIIGRIYGVYLFGGNFSNAEMQSLIENWDIWHMNGF